MIATMTTDIDCNVTGGCNTCTRSCYSAYTVYHYYDAPMAGTLFDDIKALARLLNLEACRWILKYVANWPLPVEPILKRSRKNNRMMFYKRNMAAFSLLELIMFILIWG